MPAETTARPISENVHVYIDKLGPEDVSLLERCPHFRGCYAMELGLEDVPLLERCPHFRRFYILYIFVFFQSLKPGPN